MNWTVRGAAIVVEVVGGRGGSLGSSWVGRLRFRGVVGDAVRMDGRSSRHERCGMVWYGFTRSRIGRAHV